MWKRVNALFLIGGRVFKALPLKCGGDYILIVMPPLGFWYLPDSLEGMSQVSW